MLQALDDGLEEGREILSQGHLGNNFPESQSLLIKAAGVEAVLEFLEFSSLGSLEVSHDSDNLNI